MSHNATVEKLFSTSLQLHMGIPILNTVLFILWNGYAIELIQDTAAAVRDVVSAYAAVPWQALLRLTLPARGAASLVPLLPAMLLSPSDFPRSPSLFFSGVVGGSATRAAAPSVLAMSDDVAAGGALACCCSVVAAITIFFAEQKY
jgi:hypothetical protein